MIVGDAQTLERKKKMRVDGETEERSMLREYQLWIRSICYRQEEI